MKKNIQEEILRIKQMMKLISEETSQDPSKILFDYSLDAISDNPRDFTLTLDFEDEHSETYSFNCKVTHYYPGSLGSYEDPPDSADLEYELSDIIKEDPNYPVSLEEEDFVSIITHVGIDMDELSQKLEEKLMDRYDGYEGDDGNGGDGYDD